MGKNIIDKIMKQLALVLALAVAVNANAQESVEGKGSYSTIQYPLCAATPFQVDFESEKDFEYGAELKLNTQIRMRLQAGDGCQFAVDGVSNKALTKFYLPLQGDFIRGKYISYQWDKYVYNQEGTCVFDYKSTIGALEGKVYDVSINKGLAGEMCAVNLYFKAEDCGMGCNERAREVFLYAFQEYAVERRAQYAQYFRILYMLFWYIFWMPWGAMQALGGKFDYFWEGRYELIEEMLPAGLNAWKYYYNDPERNKSLKF